MFTSSNSGANWSLFVINREKNKENFISLPSTINPYQSNNGEWLVLKTGNTVMI